MLSPTNIKGVLFSQIFLLWLSTGVDMRVYGNWVFLSFNQADTRVTATGPSEHLHRGEVIHSLAL